MNTKLAYSLASALPNVTIKDHFGSDAFSTKRMFLTLWSDSNKASIRLSPEKQQEFLSIDGEGFTAIDNAWGRMGWTSVNLEYVDKADFKAALEFAWSFSQTTTAKKAKTKKLATKKSKRPKNKKTLSSR